MEERNRDARQNADASQGAATYSAKTVEEALRRAAEELGVVPDELEYEVLKDNTHTILGLVRTGEVTLSVWRRSTPVAPAEPQPQTPAPMLAPVAEAEPTLYADDESDEREYAPSSAPVKGKSPDLEKVASDVVSTLLDKMGVLAAVEVADRGGKLDEASGEVSPLVLNIVGDDLGVLIGRRGETLRDLQFITRLIVSRKVGSWPNVVLDVENYKAKRVNALRSLAKRMADQVRRTRQAVALEPMPANERRIIHLALRDDPDVYTESTGEDEARKVQILPKK